MLNKLFFFILIGLTFCSCSSDDKDPEIKPNVQLEETVSAVDLGLSVKWATQNVGAINRYAIGNYYAWGETTPQADKKYDWSSYKWSEGFSNNITKYFMWDGYIVNDGKSVLDPEDDAATVMLGSKWRIPTSEEQYELRNKCYWVWTFKYNNSNASGFIVYKAKSNDDMGKFVYMGQTPSSNYSLNDNHIFLPAGGYYWGGKLYDGDFDIYYWSSSLDKSFNTSANRIHYRYTFKADLSGTEFRCCGLLVRPVCN